MGVLDLVILGLLAVGVVQGYRTGFFKQAGAIAGILIGFALGVGLMEPAGAYLVRISDMEPAIGPVVGFIAVFAATYLLVQILAKIGENLLGAAKLTLVNRVLGGAVGGLKAALLLSVAALGLAYVYLPPQEARESSVLYQPIASVVPAAWSFVMDNAGLLDQVTERIEGAIPDGAEAPPETEAVSN